MIIIKKNKQVGGSHSRLAKQLMNKKLGLQYKQKWKESEIELNQCKKELDKIAFEAVYD